LGAEAYKIFRALIEKKNTKLQSNIQVLWGLKLIKYLEPSLRKRIQNYEYKSRYAREYLFKIRKEITTKCKLKELTNATNIIKCRK
jgi:hypothetical protein